jgi:hypothetical protein
MNERKWFPTLPSLLLEAMVRSPGWKRPFANTWFPWASKMIGRLFFVLVLGGCLGAAASWNTGDDGSSAKASRQARQADRVIMTVAIEPDRAPPVPAPAPSVGRSSRERLIAQK